MKRLLKAIAIASASAGATYLVLYLSDRSNARSRQRQPLSQPDVDALSPEEQDRLLQELASMT